MVQPKLFIRDIQDRSDLTLVTDLYDLRSVRDSLTLKYWDYFNSYYGSIYDYSFFVKELNGEYIEIYAFKGIIPDLHKELIQVDARGIN